MVNTMPIYREARMHFFFKGNMWEREFKSYIPEMPFLNVSKKMLKRMIRKSFLLFSCEDNQKT